MYRLAAVCIGLLLTQHQHVLGAPQQDIFRQRNDVRTENVRTIKNIDIQDRFKNTAVNDLPKIVVLTEAENKYLAFLVSAIFDTLAGTKKIEENDQVFGTGKYHWPKDPAAAIKLRLAYGERNFKLRSINVSFRRDTSDGNWRYAYLSVHPLNFPSGVFEMTSPALPFTDFNLERSFNEKRPNGAVKDVNVFVYAVTRGGEGFRIVLESRPTVSDLVKTFPQSFHFMSVEHIQK